MVDFQSLSERRRAELASASSVPILPADVGLPARFRHYDPAQYDAILSLCSLRSYVAELEAPTGAGKTVIAFSYAKLRGGRFLYLCSTKALQDQALGDFASVGVVKIIGHGNYPCSRGMVLDGADSWECNAGDSCLWKRDLRIAARENRDVVANYSVWLSLQKTPLRGALGKFDVVILDEAHLAHDQIVNQMAVRITKTQVRDLAQSGSNLIETIADNDAIAEWARRIYERSEQRSIRLEGSISPESKRLLRRHQILQSELSRLEQNLSHTRWCLTGDNEVRHFTPLWAKGFVRKYLLPPDLIARANDKPTRRAKIVVASATLPPSISRRLDLDGQSSRIVVPSSFPPENRPVYFVRGTPALSYNMPYSRFQEWLALLDSILEPRLDRKCVIAAHSYNHCTEILAGSRLAGSMITHDRGGAANAINHFRQSRNPLILLSPAVAEGYNFLYDQCRLLIVAKVPFLNTRRDFLLKMRSKEDKAYAPEVVASAVAQACGRGVRRPDDWCEIVILDGQWMHFRKRRKLFPAAFREAWKMVDRMPTPPALDGRL